jgi:hypothetical protein
VPNKSQLLAQLSAEMQNESCITQLTTQLVGTLELAQHQFIARIKSQEDAHDLHIANLQ